MWLPPPASYGPVGAQVYPKLKFSAFYSHFQVTFGEMTSLAGHFWYVWSHDVLSWHVTATSCELQPCMRSNLQKMQVFGLLVTSRWLPMKRRHFRVTSGHVGSRYVISWNVTATSCELQPCRSSNQNASFRPSQPLSCEFRWNDITSGSPLVT